MKRTHGSNIARLLPMLLLAHLFAGCSSESDGGAEDVDEVTEEDTETADADQDADVDAEVEEEDTEVAEEVGPECPPETRRCVGDATSGGAQLCDENGFWQDDPCAEGEVCFEGICATADSCTPFEVDACVDCNTYSGCNPVGTARGEWPVPLTQTCVSDESGDFLRSRTCLPSEQRCANQSELLVCDECGLDFEPLLTCQTVDPTSVCDVDRCASLCDVVSKDRSYIGCEYWALDLDNAFLPQGGSIINADDQPFAIVVSNPNEVLDAHIEVERVDGVVAEAVVAPGGLEVLVMGTERIDIGAEGGEVVVQEPFSDIEGTMIRAEAFRLTSDVPIVAYQFNPLDNEGVFSNDASLLFPTTSLGTEYRVMTRRQTFDSLKGYLTIAAVEPGTSVVTIELPERTPMNPLETLGGTDFRDRSAIPRYIGGDTIEVELQQFEVFNLETDRPGADLTGALVSSTRPVVVFGGSEAANAPNDDSCVYRASFNDWVCEATRMSTNPAPCLNGAGEPDIQLCSSYITCCADHLEHQMLPSFAWGERYIAARSQSRGDEPDIWRVMSGRDGTRVQLVGLPTTWPLPGLLPTRSLLREEGVVLDEGEWIDFNAPIDFEIVADGPIMVGQFLAAEEAPYDRVTGDEMPEHFNAGIGDPAFILAVPTEQFRADYTFLAPNAFEEDYITITAPAGASVELDGEVLDPEVFETIGDGNYEVARLSIEDGAHRLLADVPVGVIVYGFDRYVSYGYAAGLDLRELDAD